jgi:cytidylate kinase
MDLLLQGKARSLASSPNVSAFLYVNSGALYRAVAWLANEHNIPCDDWPQFALRCECRSLIFPCTTKSWSCLIDGNNPQTHLRDERVNRTVSAISAIAEVREFLVAHLREFQTWDNLVMEGRDIGSMVFPDTPISFISMPPRGSGTTEGSSGATR